jgi:hypothetical protein
MVDGFFIIAVRQVPMDIFSASRNFDIGILALSNPVIYSLNSSFQFCFQGG